MCVKCAHRPKVDAIERFLSHVIVVESGCWEWNGAYVEKNGYGGFWDGARWVRAHVFSFVFFKGQIPMGFVVDHTCHNNDRLCKDGASCRHRRCVNPDHLRTATIGDNALAGNSLFADEARRTHCIHGHEFTLDNTYIRKDNGHRVCMTCSSIRNRDTYERKHPLVSHCHSNAFYLRDSLVKDIER